jgi:hypothetical protein
VLRCTVSSLKSMGSGFIPSERSVDCHSEQEDFWCYVRIPTHLVGRHFRMILDHFLFEHVVQRMQPDSCVVRLDINFPSDTNGSVHCRSAQRSSKSFSVLHKGNSDLGREETTLTLQHFNRYMTIIAEAHYTMCDAWTVVDLVQFRQSAIWLNSGNFAILIQIMNAAKCRCFINVESDCSILKSLETFHVWESLWTMSWNPHWCS